MSDHPSLEDLAAFADNLLLADDRLSVESHLNQCSECLIAVAMARNLRDLQVSGNLYAVHSGNAIRKSWSARFAVAMSGARRHLARLEQIKEDQLGMIAGTTALLFESYQQGAAPAHSTALPNSVAFKMPGDETPRIHLAEAPGKPDVWVEKDHLHIQFHGTTPREATVTIQGQTFVNPVPPSGHVQFELPHSSPGEQAFLPQDLVLEIAENSPTYPVRFEAVEGSIQVTDDQFAPSTADGWHTDSIGNALRSMHEHGHIEHSPSNPAIPAHDPPTEPNLPSHPGAHG